MAQYKFAAALNAATFPLVTRFQPRPVLIGQMDNRLRDPSSNPQSNFDNNPQNLPQVTYMENVMPTTEGCRSTGFSNVQAAIPGAGTPDDVYIIRDGGINSWYYMPAQGMNYVTQTFGNPWVSTNPLAGAPLGTGVDVSLAYVNGVSYSCFSQTALLQWNGVNFVNVSGTLAGIAIGNLRSICGAGNYLIGIDAATNSIRWSSLTNPLDFVPSTITGAGNQIPLDMRGPPELLSPISGGFLIHCSENVVAAVYTNNVAQPWIFREVRNSGGIITRYGLSKESSTGSVYMFNHYGLQSLNLRDAENIHANVTDFITDKILETFNSATNLLSISRVTQLHVKLAFVAGRYLCLSYTDVAAPYPTYKYALIFDSSLKRWGKIKVDHKDIFGSGVNLNDRPKSAGDGLHVLKPDGSVDQIVLDERVQADSGVLILGRYQLSRTHQICSQELELEVFDSNEAPTVHIATNYNGTTVGEILAMTLHQATDNYRRYQKQIEGENLSYIIKGSFSIASLLLTTTKGARTNT